MSDPLPETALHAAFDRLDAALDHLASRATATRAVLDALAGDVLLPQAGSAATQADIAALADRLDQTLARLRAVAEGHPADPSEPQGD